MTALAMIIGMLPMSLGLGEGGEQNAPLGRAVIGGLLLATVFTLLFVPVMYSLLRRKPPRREEAGEEASGARRPAGRRGKRHLPCGGSAMNQQPADERLVLPAPNETPAPRRIAPPAAGTSSGDANNGRHRRGRLAWASARWPRSPSPARSWRPRCRGCGRGESLGAAAARLAEAPPLVSVAGARRRSADLRVDFAGQRTAIPRCRPLRPRQRLPEALAGGHRRPRERRPARRRDQHAGRSRPARQARANLVLSEANLHVAEANRELAKITVDRDVKAGVGTATSLQTIDQDRA